MGIPAAAVVASFVTLAFALWQPMTELPPAYHWEGERLDHDLARFERAAAIDVRAKLALAPAEHLCRMRFTSDAAPPAALVLTLVHATERELDRSITLRAIADGYEGWCDAPPDGHWHAQLADQGETWMVRAETTGAINSLEFSGRGSSGSTP
jgi:hypothetical protein